MDEIKDSDFLGDYEDNDNDIYGELFQQMAEEERIKHENELRNIHRDKRGRLYKGARLASKDCCNVEGILLRHDSGMSVKEIVKSMGCSKSTVYNVIKNHRKKDK